VGIALWSWLRTLRWEEFIKREMYLVIPALIYSIYLNFFFQAQIGIRFLLVVFPITLIFCTRIFQDFPHLARRSRIFFAMTGVYLVVSVFSYFPDYLAYFNEIVLDRTQAYHYLADSNIDWGQNKADLAIFLAQHPDYIFQPDHPTAGTVVVGVNELVGVLGKPEDFQWLRDKFKPIGNFRNSYLIYNISAVDLAK
jgi:hypothetical protein